MKPEYVYCKCGGMMSLADERLTKRHLRSIFWGIHNAPNKCGKVKTNARATQ